MNDTNLDNMKMIVLSEMPDNFNDVKYLIKNSTSIEQLKMARYLLLDHNSYNNKLLNTGAKKVNEEINKVLKENGQTFQFDPVEDLPEISRAELVKWGCLKE